MLISAQKMNHLACWAGGQAAIWADPDPTTVAAVAPIPANGHVNCRLPSNVVSMKKAEELRRVIKDDLQLAT